jgi:hypothetical protein
MDWSFRIELPLPFPEAGGLGTESFQVEGKFVPDQIRLRIPKID